ncbi:MAG: hypothetical protein ACJAUL_001069 [Paraglaciecola sp.]|jgi:hypothetical protein
MNITTPFLTTVSFATANVNTEAARRDNSLRETVPALSGAENGAPETGLGNEADRLKSPAQPVVYERPQTSAQPQGETEQNAANQDNAKDASAGKEEAEQRQQAQQEQQKMAEIAELKERDAEVRSHEQAHASLGGQHAAAPQYNYTNGPDGRRYAVDGYVSIDIAQATSPEETIGKMQQVKAAALAPAEPSAQDVRVASQASQKTIEARNQISAQRLEDNQTQFNPLAPDESEIFKQSIELENIGQVADVSPTRTLDDSQAASLDRDPEYFARLLAGRDEKMHQRENVIQTFYQQVTQPKNIGFDQSALAIKKIT